MNTKIQELTEKIFQEGVEKGNAQAKSIIESAKAQEESILKEAQAKADKIIAEAQKKANDLKKNTEAELTLYAGQALSVVKAEITNLIGGEIINTAVGSTLSQKDFMSQFMLTLAKEWTQKESICIESTEAKALTDFFMANAKELLNKGVTIREVGGKKATFAVTPSDGSYKISFGEEEFKAYFESFLRPQLVEMLFKK